LICVLVQEPEVFLSLGGTAPAAGSLIAEAKSKAEAAHRRPSVGSDETEDGGEGLGLSLSLGASSYEEEARHDGGAALDVVSDGKERGYALLESSKMHAPAAAEDLAAAGIGSQGGVNPANRKTRVSVRVRCQGPTVRHGASFSITTLHCSCCWIASILAIDSMLADERWVPMAEVWAEGR
jgi:hypothetical protein